MIHPIAGWQHNRKLVLIVFGSPFIHRHVHTEKNQGNLRN
jgi:hypothetical protein